jgi:hypothetical protein
MRSDTVSVRNEDRTAMKVWWIWLVVAWVAADAWLARWWWLLRRENRAEAHVRFAAGKYGVDPALVKAVAWRESRFKEDARGAAGELGLMQVGALAAEEWAGAERLANFRHEDLLDPRSNTLAGHLVSGPAVAEIPGDRQPGRLCSGRLQRGAGQCPAVDQGRGVHQQRGLSGVDRLPDDA